LLTALGLQLKVILSLFITDTFSLALYWQLYSTVAYKLQHLPFDNIFKQNVWKLAFSLLPHRYDVISK